MKRAKAYIPDLFSLRCEECGEYCTTTPSGYLVCPKGHGKLHEAEPVQAAAVSIMLDRCLYANSADQS